MGKKCPKISRRPYDDRANSDRTVPVTPNRSICDWCIKRWYAINTYKKILRDRRSVTLTGSANPKEVSQQCTPSGNALPEGPLGGFHPCLWPLKAPGSTFGEGSPRTTERTCKQHKWQQNVRCIQNCRQIKPAQLAFWEHFNIVYLLTYLTVREAPFKQ